MCFHINSMLRLCCIHLHSVKFDLNVITYFGLGYQESIKKHEQNDFSDYLSEFSSIKPQMKTKNIQLIVWYYHILTQNCDIFF